MICKTLKAKNILSYGNKFTELNLDNNLSNLIIGNNGSGKSSLTSDALYYVLAGKTFRDIKLSELINKQNKKNLVVELIAEHNGNEIKIIRGQKPAIFEIYKNGEKIEESAKSVDYQKTLEKLLNFDPKTFKNTVLISSSFYTPFLRMTAGEKREFIEKILNIEVFSDMRELLRLKTSVLKENILSNGKDIERVQSNIEIIENVNQKKKAENKRERDIIQTDYDKELAQLNDDHEQKLKDIEQEQAEKLKEIESNSDEKAEQLKQEYEKQVKDEQEKFDQLLNTKQKDYTESIKKSNDDYENQKQSIQDTLYQLRIEIKNLNDSKANILSKIEHLQKSIDYDKEKCIKYDEYKQKLWKINNKISSLREEQSFFKTNRKCNQCKQDITDEYVEQINIEFDQKIGKLEKSRQKGQKLIDRIEQIKEQIAENEEQISEFKKQESDVNNQINMQELSLSDNQRTAESLNDDHKKDLEQIKTNYQKDVDSLTNFQNEKLETLKSNYKKSNDQLADSEQLRTALLRHISIRTSDTIATYEKMSQKLQETFKTRCKALDNLELESVDHLNEELRESNAEKSKLIQKQSYYKIITQILSDKGIKTYILRKYIPILNQYINNYLDTLNATYRIMFDEHLKESISSSNCKDMSYGSFSMGEKSRIDLSMLFAFIKLATLKESGSSTNLIVLDEVIDSGVDGVGIDGLIKILDMLKREGKSIFTISHRENLETNFDQTIRVSKKVFTELNFT